MTTGFSITGTVFSAVPTTVKNRTADELIQESNVKLNKENISFKTANNTSNNSLVTFQDPVNNKNVIVSLDKYTIAKLQDHFDKDDFYTQDNGIIKLNNVAESFVSGWFGDIAYKRDFIKADVNQDGLLAQDEYLNTRNDFHGHGEIDSLENITSGKETVDEKYTLVKDNDSRIISYNRKDKSNPVSIDQELNRTINLDKDFNGEMSLRESYNYKSKNINLTDEEIIKNNAKDSELYEFFDPELFKKLLLAKLEEKSRNMQIEALDKLKQLNGNFDELSFDDQKYLTALKELKDNQGNIPVEKITDIQVKHNIMNQYDFSKNLNFTTTTFSA